MKSLRCAPFKRLILLHTYGELDDSCSERLRAHVQGCDDCRESMKSFRRIHAGIPAPGEYEPSVELIGKIKTDCREALSESASRIPLPRLLLRPALAVFASIILILLLFTLNGERNEHIYFADEYEYEIIDRKLVDAENSLHALDMDISFLLDYFQ